MFRARIWLVFVYLLVSASLCAMAQSGSEPPVLQPHRTIKTPLQRKTPAPAKQAEVLVSCDIACTFTFDGEAKGRMDADGSVKVKSGAGRHLVVATAEGSTDRVVKTVDLIPDKQELLQVELKSIRDTRLQGERAEQQRQAAAEQAEQQRQAAAEQAQQQQRQARAHADELYQQAKSLSYGSTERARLFQLSCEGGNAKACDETGNAYYTGAGVSESDERAAYYFGLACDGDVANGCSYAGSILSNQNNLEKANEYYAHARKIYQSACERNDEDGACWRLGDLWNSGHGGPKDKSQAASLYLKSCSGENSTGCKSMGDAYAEGQDYSRAAQYYERACNGSGIWCKDLAALCADGKGVPQNKKRAHELYQKSCKAGDSDSCSK